MKMTMKKKTKTRRRKRWTKKIRKHPVFKQEQKEVCELNKKVNKYKSNYEIVSTYFTYFIHGAFKVLTISIFPANMS